MIAADVPASATKEYSEIMLKSSLCLQFGTYSLRTGSGRGHGPCIQRTFSVVYGSTGTFSGRPRSPLDPLSLLAVDVTAVDLAVNGYGNGSGMGGRCKTTFPRLVVQLM
jgi:hypothetical protein